MPNERKDCPIRHANGNCLCIGGFCTGVNDEICNGLRAAYQSGKRAAADVAKVKHGKWTATGLCSNCHKPYQGGCFSDYCPNCGARMDGGI